MKLYFVGLIYDDFQDCFSQWRFGAFFPSVSNVFACQEIRAINHVFFAQAVLCMLLNCSTVLS